MDIKEIKSPSSLDLHSVNPLLVEDEQEVVRVLSLSDNFKTLKLEITVNGSLFFEHINLTNEEVKPFVKEIKSILNFFKPYNQIVDVFCIIENNKLYVYDVYINENWMSEKDMTFFLNSISSNNYIPCKTGLYNSEQIISICLNNSKENKKTFILPAMYLKDERKVELTSKRIEIVTKKPVEVTSAPVIKKEYLWKDNSNKFANGKKFFELLKEKKLLIPETILSETSLRTYCFLVSLLKNDKIKDNFTEYVYGNLNIYNSIKSKLLRTEDILIGYFNHLNLINEIPEAYSKSMSSEGIDSVTLYTYFKPQIENFYKDVIFDIIEDEDEDLPLWQTCCLKSERDGWVVDLLQKKANFFDTDDKFWKRNGYSLCFLISLLNSEYIIEDIALNSVSKSYKDFVTCLSYYFYYFRNDYPSNCLDTIIHLDEDTLNKYFSEEIKDFEIIFDEKIDEINNVSSTGVKDAQ